MERATTSPRRDWRQIVESQGMYFHHNQDDSVYWDESVYYTFTQAEIDELEKASYALNDMCLQAVEHVVSQRLFEQFLVPPEFVPYVVESWETEEQTICGRFDLAFDGQGPPKLLEYNADTPTGLLEAAVIQWFWFEDFSRAFYSLDQFNSIHERLIEAWKGLRESVSSTLYFTSVDDGAEDYTTVSYLRDTAMQAGFQTEYITIDNVGWNDGKRSFMDLAEQPIETIFKLYPWEWLMQEDFASHLLERTTRWLEAPWKMLLSNKAMLAVLHQLYPDSPYLLRTEFEPFGATYVSKPRLGREGSNVTIVRNGDVMSANPGDYADCPSVYQEYIPLPNLQGNYSIIGSWIVNGYACGIGVREDTTPITTNNSRFVPHLFRKS